MEEHADVSGLTPDSSDPAEPRSESRGSGASGHYAEVDLERARRNGALLGVLGVAIALPCLLLVPPTTRIGPAGWLVTALITVSALAASARASRNNSFEEGLALAYLALAQIVALEWLAGGYKSPFHALYILPLVYVAAVHTPVRIATFAVTLCAVAALPLLYDGWSARAAGSILSQNLLWLGLVVISYRLMRHLRTQRIGLSRRGEEARRLARVDPLTGLGNRRAFDETLDRDLARSKRSGSPLTVVIADLDGFKEINDRFGHSQGDQCLRAVAATIDEEVRRPDACFRWGGDEFVILLPETDRCAAELVTSRLAAAIEDRCSIPSGDSLSVSFGVAETDPDTTGPSLLDSADRELIARKTDLGAA